MDDMSEILDGIRQQDLAAYCDGSMAFIDSTNHLGSVGKVNTDALILGLCLGGGTTVAIDGREFVLAPGDLLVCLPGVTIDRSR